MIEELDFELEDENDDIQMGGLDSFRKGVFKVPLYLVRENSTFFRKKKTKRELDQSQEMKASEAGATGANPTPAIAAGSKKPTALNSPTLKKKKPEENGIGPEQVADAVLKKDRLGLKNFLSFGTSRRKRDQSSHDLGTPGGASLSSADFGPHVRHQTLGNESNHERSEFGSASSRVASSASIHGGSKRKFQSHSSGIDALVSSRLISRTMPNTATEGNEPGDQQDPFSGFSHGQSNFDEQQVNMMLRIKGFNTVEDDGVKFVVGEYETIQPKVDGIDSQETTNTTVDILDSRVCRNPAREKPVLSWKLNRRRGQRLSQSTVMLL